jgi:subtilisin family serine protease
VLHACGRVALAAVVAAALVLLVPLVSPAGLPHDHRQPRQWALSRAAALDIPSAWRLSQGAGVVVAVVDTGTRADHPDLAPNLWVNPGEIAGNGIDDDANGVVDDVHGVNLTTEGAPGDISDRNGHGTLVAGVLAAAADGRGIVGVAYRSRLMTIKVFDAAATGSTPAVAEGIRYAVEHGARIVNLSLGSDDPDPGVRSAIEEAGAAQVLVVCSAGNMRRDVDAVPSYPVSLPEPNVLGGGATVAADGGRTPAPFSNWGPAAVPVAAPGERILTTSRDGRYAYAWGTSLAAPHVTGVAALVASISPGISAVALRAALVDHAAPGSAAERPRILDAPASVRSVR